MKRGGTGRCVRWIASTAVLLLLPLSSVVATAPAADAAVRRCGSFDRVATFDGIRDTYRIRVTARRVTCRVAMSTVRGFLRINAGVIDYSNRSPRGWRCWASNHYGTCARVNWTDRVAGIGYRRL